MRKFNIKVSYLALVYLTEHPKAVTATHTLTIQTTVSWYTVTLPGVCVHVHSSYCIPEQFAAVWVGLVIDGLL